MLLNSDSRMTRFGVVASLVYFAFGRCTAFFKLVSQHHATTGYAARGVTVFWFSHKSLNER
jgi:hypothetical protein